ncbi:SRPBCC family protein [Aliiglaciecola litoralis]|uniref:Polyketide cyclase / dehydrase and lipid transport n=1 Tax=Aliiglaciecola litoralis TaxID=582857 RepID=A0ABP3WVI3_9ALTE
MTLLKRCLIGLLFIVVTLMIIGLFLPSKYSVERSIVINAPANEIYPQLVDLRKWRQWGVWFERDLQMSITYTGPDNEVGMKSSWKSDTEGDGEMTITALVPNKQVTYHLYFPAFEMGSTGELVLQEQASSTTVTWRDSGDVGNNPVNRYFALVMDSMIGPDFQQGLKNLKNLVEKTN